MKRTAPFSKTTIRNAAIAAAFAVAPIGLYAVGVIAGPSEEMVAKNKANIDRCIELKGNTDACDRIKRSKTYIPNGYQPTADLTISLRKEAKAKAEAERKAAEQRQAEAAAKVIAERQAKKAAAEAKFKAEGWWEAKPGIFIRWCGNGSNHPTCPGPRGNGYSDYVWRAMVWCKERPCGDIYARLNISNGGTVVGWTNATAYGGFGQKVVLTFGSSTRGSGEIVEFNARG